jgi:hypothetical protein
MWGPSRIHIRTYLILIYINDLGTFSSKLSTIMFADDSNLFTSGSDLPNLTNTINQELPQLINWLRANRLSLNIAKTHFMLFGPKKKIPPQDINILIEGNKLRLTKSTKFLGIILDSNISWKDHIIHLSKKIAKSVGILSIARKILNQKSLIQLYYSFIYPYLTYCVLIWGNSPASTLWPVFKLQKISIRIIANLTRRNSSLQFCKKNSLLRLPEIYSLYTGIFMYKYHHSLLPEIFNNLFTQNRSIHNYNTRNATNLRIPRVKTKIGETFITKTGVHIWNNLPKTIQESNSIKIFKNSLIKVLLAKY